ncbi:hypothetical protein LOAG_13041 [Loa loa]|uniref:Uncharacterized protein n=1 Tax=Loa loa TaxID=7209 RepID=A0A1S0TK53_LOALO|nr:hypothetical protein LOAG_13041 [Loa loa]EFO15469.2 hypothetical protein LOAG_13041 [Loa loa]
MNHQKPISHLRIASGIIKILIRIKQINTEDSLAMQSSTLSNARSQSESRSMMERSPVLLMSKKAYSVGAVNYSDPGYLMEALETLADVQPRVARSIPKHAIIDTSNFAARSLDNCLFDATNL